MVLANAGSLRKVPTFVRKMTVDGIKIAKIAKTLPVTFSATSNRAWQGFQP